MEPGQHHEPSSVLPKCPISAGELTVRHAILSEQATNDFYLHSDLLLNVLIRLQFHSAQLVAAALFVQMVSMMTMGAHPTLGQGLPKHSDKLLHFVTFSIATHIFYWIWIVKDETLRRIWHWRHLPRILTLAICFSRSLHCITLNEADPGVSLQAQPFCPNSSKPYSPINLSNSSIL